MQFPTFLVFYSSQDSLCKCLKISMQVDGCLFFQFSIASNVPKETLNFVHSPLYIGRLHVYIILWVWLVGEFMCKKWT